MTAGVGHRVRLGAAIGAGVAAISPFDLARPEDGWTQLHLRPLLLVTAGAALVMVALDRDRIERSVVVATAVLVAGFATASALSPDPGSGFAVTVRVAVLGVVFCGAAAAFGTSTDRRVLLVGVAVGAGLASAIGLVVLANGADRFGTDALLGSISVSRGVTRLTRPFSHANVAAMYLAPAAVLVAGGAVAVISRTGRMASVAVATGASVALALTLSRGGLVGLVTSLGVLAVLRWRFPGLARTSGDRPTSGADDRLLAIGLPLGLAAVAIGVVAVSGRLGLRLDAASSVGAGTTAGPPSLSRPAIWSQAIDALIEQPMIGIGPGRFGVYSRAVTPAAEAAAAHAHNPILEAAATGGLVAMAGVAVFITVILRRTVRRLRTVPFGLSAALSAAMLPMVADDPFLFSSSGNLAALVGGAWYAAARPLPA